MTVSIRPLKIEDAYTSVKWRNDSSVFQYTGNIYDHEITIESELAWIERVINKKDDYRCAIEVDGAYVGNIYLTDIHDGEAEYHIFIGNKEYWGKGVAKEASKQILTYAKEKLSLHDVILEVRRENVRAIELYKAVGFQFIKAEGDKWIMRVDINQEKPLVAIHCLVYNHEPYLRDCFEGFVMQKTNFRFVAIVHEDCSTDHSANIIREYEAKYPDIFRPIYETENQWSKHDGSLERIMNAAIDATGAKYIAMCEGDDYWTDPYKLQKQVDFMEAHPEYSMCFHKINVLLEDEVKENVISKNIPVGEWNARDIYGKWSVSTCSVLYRYFHPEYDKRVLYGDIFLFLQCAEQGRIYCHNMTASTYRRHKGGKSVTLCIRDIMQLYEQYRFMEKRFPSLQDISENEKNRYLDLLCHAKYTYGIGKYRYIYMLHHPRKFFSRYHIRTLFYLIKDTFCCMR